MILCCSGLDPLLSLSFLGPRLLPRLFPLPPCPGLLDCLLYCALKTAEMLDFFFGRSLPSSAFFSSVLGVAFFSSAFGAEAAFSSAFGAAFGASSFFINLLRTTFCASSSRPLDALLTAYSVVLKASIISCDFIFNSFASS